MVNLSAIIRSHHIPFLPTFTYSKIFFDSDNSKWLTNIDSIQLCIMQPNIYRMMILPITSTLQMIFLTSLGQTLINLSFFKFNQTNPFTSSLMIILSQKSHFMFIPVKILIFVNVSLKNMV